MLSPALLSGRAREQTGQQHRFLSNSNAVKGGIPQEYHDATDLVGSEDESCAKGMMLNPFSLRDMMNFMVAKKKVLSGITFDEVIESLKTKANELNMRAVEHNTPPPDRRPKQPAGRNPLLLRSDYDAQDSGLLAGIPGVPSLQDIGRRRCRWSDLACDNRLGCSLT